MAFDELSDQDLQDSIMELEKSGVALGNMRSLEKTPEDALAGYDAQVEKAHLTVAEGLHGQAVRFKAMGWVGTSNTQWNLSPDFHNALWLIADHEGPQALRKQVLALEYGMSLADKHFDLA